MTVIGVSFYIFLVWPFNRYSITRNDRKTRIFHLKFVTRIVFVRKKSIILLQEAAKNRFLCFVAYLLIILRVVILVTTHPYPHNLLYLTYYSRTTTIIKMKSLAVDVDDINFSEYVYTASKTFIFSQFCPRNFVTVVSNEFKYEKIC